MTSRHPDLEAEQAYFDLAHACLDTARERAAMATSVFRTGRGGTTQARFEREAMLEATLARLTKLNIGDRSLVFGRIDPAGTGERFYIGRVGLWDADHDPILVDWRAPVAEPFYRATGREPLGLERRRHFASRGSTLLGIEDEFFGDKAAIGLDLADRDFDGVAGPPGDGRLDGRTVSSALIASLDAARTGRLGDIVATIQGEQDRVIRADMPGVLVVQGGPGTGKTVVALHRAAYLLYTHRFPLESQGVLVVGPNPLFLAYIEQVLPSLGEAGVEQAVLADLLSPAVRVAGLDNEAVGRIKGDPRMAGVVRRAVRDRRRRLRDDLTVGYELQRLKITVEQSAEIVADAARRIRKHNAGRRLVEEAFFTTLAASARQSVDPAQVRDSLSDQIEVREALEWMWPVLTPAHLVNDLYGSKALLRSAAGGRLGDDETGLLHRPRARHASDVTWSFQDVPVLDEARALLGYRPGHREEDAVLTYGHIVVDEAQDLSPMELRMIARRSLNGSMTVVGDIAQATGSWAHDGWESVLEGLPDRRPARRVELTLGYRIPAPAMALANRVLPYAAPGAMPPSTVRTVGDEPRTVACGAAAARSEPAMGRPSSHDLAALGEALAQVVAEEQAEVGEGNVAVIVPDSLHEPLRVGLKDRSVVFGGPGRSGLEQQVTLVPVRLVKGLEVDAAVVVEPARIVAEECQGIRSLYVALTRATRRVTVVHTEPLPDVLVQPYAAA
ncbi:MAG: ATP-binding domain-containing protein [Acidimicrobiia bacterium]|nr:ATP-binding domain-containing protein [Acidimicrobiia bacterium]